MRIGWRGVALRVLVDLLEVLEAGSGRVYVIGAYARDVNEIAFDEAVSADERRARVDASIGEGELLAAALEHPRPFEA